MKKFKIIKNLCLALSIITILSSCGVMFGGSKYTGTIVAKDHPDADIYVNGNKAGQGQVIGTYRRNRALAVELRQEGCEPKTQTFDYDFRTGNFILSLVTWGLVGIAIDLGTGASYKPEHKSNPAVERISDKNYTFLVDYPDCPSN